MEFDSPVDAFDDIVKVYHSTNENTLQNESHFCIQFQ